MTKVAKL